MKYLKAILKIFFAISFYIIVQVLLIKLFDVQDALVALSIGSLISLLVYALVFRNVRKCIKKINLEDFTIGLSSGFLTIFISTIAIFVVVLIYPDITKRSSELIDYLRKGNVAIVFISVVLLGPIIEEVIFRCIVFSELSKITTIKKTIVIQAVLFSLFHANLYQLLYTFLIGILLGYILYKTKNLLVTIVAHMVNNLLSLLPLFTKPDVTYSFLLFTLSTIAILKIQNK